ncbi:MAG: MFS transporter [Telluria sp.]
MNKEYVRNAAIPATGGGRFARALREAMPDNWSLLMAAFSSAYGIGLLAMLVLPFMISSTMNGLHIDEAQAGLLGTAEFLAVMLASLAVSPFIGRIPRRTIAVIGACLAIGGNVASVFQGSYEVLLFLRPVVGFGCGLALAAGNATVANADNPEKLAAQMSVLFVVLMVLAMEVFSRISDSWGFAGVYGALAVFMLCLAGFLFKLPQRANATLRATKEHPHAHRGLFSAVSLLMLVAMFAFALRDTMMWAFAERIGQAAGYSTEQLGSLFSIQAVLGIAGPMLASVIGGRNGLKRPAMLGIVMTGIVTFTILQSSNAKLPYTIGVLFISGTYFYALSYLTAVAAELDVEGRVVAASGGFLVAGVAIGPAVSGFLIVHGGYDLASWVNSGIVVLTLLLLLVPLGALKSQADRLRT